jgi:hypothetical protein
VILFSAGGIDAIGTSPVKRWLCANSRKEAIMSDGRHGLVGVVILAIVVRLAIG